jgi:hypothetical protein
MTIYTLSPKIKKISEYRLTVKLTVFQTVAEGSNPSTRIIVFLIKVNYFIVAIVF